MVSSGGPSRRGHLARPGSRRRARRRARAAWPRSPERCRSGSCRGRSRPRAARMRVRVGGRVGQGGATPGDSPADADDGPCEPAAAVPRMQAGSADAGLGRCHGNRCAALAASVRRARRRRPPPRRRPTPADRRAGSHLVTLDGPGTAGYRGTLSARVDRDRCGTPQDAVLAGGRCRAGLPLDHRAQRLRRRAHRRRRPAAAATDPRVAARRGERGPHVSPAHRASGGPVAPDALPAAARASWSASSTPASGPRARSSPDPRPRGAQPRRLPRRVRGRRGLAAVDLQPQGRRRPVVRRTASARTAAHARAPSPPRDDHGHGTQVASIAAGNADVSVEAPRPARLATYRRLAPQARIAVYKACWTAPDPSDDGCATADLVTAIDRATRDGVDVLNLVGGRSARHRHRGARPAGRGRGRRRRGRRRRQRRPAAYAAHAVALGDHGRRRPPATSGAGGSPGRRRPTLTGAMAVVTPGRAGPARPRRAGRRAAARRRTTPRCAHRARLDASAHRRRRSWSASAAGSAASTSPPRSAQADGVGMVLVNTRRGTGRGRPARRADRPPRPSAAAGVADLARRPSARPGHACAPLGLRREPGRVRRWSGRGDPTATAGQARPGRPGVGRARRRAAGGPSRTRWDFVSGTSAADRVDQRRRGPAGAAHPTGRPPRIRSALSPRPARSGRPSALRSGAGRPARDRAERAGAGLPRPAPATTAPGSTAICDRDLNAPVDPARPRRPRPSAGRSPTSGRRPRTSPRVARASPARRAR